MSESGKNSEVIPIGAGRGRRYWVRFYAFLSVASIVAAIGLNADSGAIVIAAMLLAPLMEPILGIGSSLVRGDLGRVTRLLLSTVIAALVTVLWGYAVLLGFGNPRDVEIPALILARTSPGLPDLVVALVAGSAGAYVQLRREEAGFLPGVAIGVSLVPPLAAVGMLIYLGAPNLAGEAALLFATNLAAIVLSACTVFYALGMRPAGRAPGATARMTLGTIVTIIAVLAIAIHLAERTTRLLQEAHEEQQITQVLRNWAGEHRVDIQKVDVSGDRVAIVVLVGVPVFRTAELAPISELVPKELRQGEDIEQRIADMLGRKVHIDFTALLTFFDKGVFSPSKP